MAGVHLIDMHSKAVILRLKSGWPWGGRQVLSKGGDEFLCQTGDLRAVLWNRRFGKRLLDDPVGGAMAVSPDGKYIGLAEYPDYAEVWKIRPNGSVQRAAYKLGKPPGARYLHVSRRLAFSPDSRSLVISGSQGDVTIWRFLKGTSVTFQ